MIERRYANRGDRKAGEKVREFMAGDRISVPGFAGGTRFTERRHGTIVEAYEGAGHSKYNRVRFYAVRWDDMPSVVDRGHVGIRFRLEGEAAQP